MPEQSTKSVPIGKGDIRYVYLDENYSPTTNDIGRMAMYVENNELTKDILVVSEIRDNNIDNEIAVSVINRQNKSLTSFFYRNGQYFPYKVIINIDGEEITGNFSLYNMLKETYSVNFEYEDGGSDSFTNFILNKNVFSLHKDNTALTDTQNVRIRHIITTLGLWESLALQMDENFEIGSRAIKWLKALCAVFAVVAVVALAVVVIVSAPAAITVAGLTLTVSITSTPAAVAAGVAVAAGAGSVITGILSEKDLPSPPPNPVARPMISIKLNNTDLENNKTLYYIKNIGESLTFDLKLTYYDYGQYKSSDEIIDMKNLICWFDPEEKKYGEKDTNNAKFFNIDTVGDINNTLHITVTRNSRPGYIDEGRVQLVLKFRVPVIFNGRDNGIDFWSDQNEPVKNCINIFVINLTVLN